MLDAVLYEISDLKWLIITMIVTCSIICLVMFLLLGKFDWKESKIRLFSLLCGLDTRDCICLSLILTRSIYIIYLAANNEKISVEYLVTLIVMSIIICILEKEYYELVISALSSIAVYVIVYLLSSLVYFYKYVEHEYIVFIMIVFLFIFIILYSLYSLISSYNHMIVLNRSDSANYESLDSVHKIKWPKTKQNGKLKSSSSD